MQTEPGESPAPVPGPLYVGNWDTRGKILGWRPRGTKDWLMLFTDRGSARVLYAGGELKLGPGEMVVYEPGTMQDYGQPMARGRWKHVWVHWMPRPEFIRLLAWPLVVPGIRRLQVPAGKRGSLFRELRAADAYLRGPLAHREAAALNAVERAVLICDTVNPDREKRSWHPRIEESVNYLTQHFERREKLEVLAARFGFSRSRFAELFRGQVGRTPADFVEGQRLQRARQLLSFTRQTLDQVAEDTGYSSAFHLSASFKKHFGASPRDFRQSLEKRSPGRKR